MSDRERREPRGTGGAAKSMGGNRAAGTADDRQQEIIHNIRDRQQQSLFHRLIALIKSIFGR